MVGNLFTFKERSGNKYLDLLRQVQEKRICNNRMAAINEAICEATILCLICSLFRDEEPYKSLCDNLSTALEMTVGKNSMQNNAYKAATKIKIHGSFKDLLFKCTKIANELSDEKIKVICNALEMHKAFFVDDNDSKESSGELIPY